MTLSDISSIAVSVSVALIMLMSGMLLNPAVFRRQFNRKTLAEFANLAMANYLVIPIIVLGGLWLVPLDPMSKLALLTLAMLPCAPMIPALAVFCDESPDWALFVLIGKSLLNLSWMDLLALVLFEAVCVAVAYLVVRGATAHRITAILTCTMRNFAMGVAFTTILFAHTAAPVTMLAYATLMSLSILGTVTLYQRRTAATRVPHKLGNRHV